MLEAGWTEEELMEIQQGNVSVLLPDSNTWQTFTANQAFGVPAFPVDTHIHRLLYRWGFTKGTNVIQTEKDAKRLFPKSRWNDLHLQIIWYGREYCPARGWDIEKDLITKKIGRKTVLKKQLKNLS